MKDFSSLSNQLVLVSIEKLCQVEHETTLELLLYLKEIDQRKLYADLGYSSLFSFCSDKLGYSEGSANRRVASVRAIAKFPKIFTMLETKQLTLTTTAMISGIITAENLDEVLAKVSSKSQRQVEEIVSSYKAPLSLVRDRIVPVHVIVRKAEEALPSLFESEKKPNDFSRHCGVTSFSDEKDTRAPIAEQHYKIQFGGDAEFLELFNRVKEISGEKDIATLFKRLMKSYLKAKAPKERQDRRENRELKIKEQQSTPSANTRYIPAPLRDKVLLSDNCQCSYVSKDGVRCKERKHLQIEHCQPFAKGGSNLEENLRTLCFTHNRMLAERVYGQQFMQQFQVTKQKVNSLGKT